MVSKTLICVFVALCCAQAFASAAPSEESALKTHNVGYSSVCLERIRGLWPLIQDANTIAIDFIKIFVKAKIDTAACFKKGGTADEILACKEAVYKAKEAALNAEFTILGQKAEYAFEVIQIVVAECL